MEWNGNGKVFGWRGREEERERGRERVEEVLAVVGHAGHGISMGVIPAAWPTACTGHALGGFAHRLPEGKMKMKGEAASPQTTQD